MIIDNKYTEKMIETNNIIGKYYKGNSVNIKTTTNNAIYKINNNFHQNLNYNFIKNENENENESNLEKIVIGNKKFLKHRKLILSSFQITKNILLNDNENENNDFLNNINSNHNIYYKKLINSNINDTNNKKIETNFQHKLKKVNNQKLIRFYTNKLKIYCSNLKIMKKKAINRTKHSKLNESSSQGNKIAKKDTIGKEKNKNHVTILINKDCKDKENNNQKNKTILQNKIQNQNIYINTKNHAKVNDKKSPVKIINKKSIRRNRAQSIDKIVEKAIFIKKMAFRSKQINSVGVNNEKQLASNLFYKRPKKNKGCRGSNSINKNASSGIIRKTKFFNQNNNMKSNNIMNSNNDIPSNNFKLNAANSKEPVDEIKRANTGINRLYLFKGNVIKLKESIDD
jgi:hypothetical protein